MEISLSLFGLPFMYTAFLLAICTGTIACLITCYVLSTRANIMVLGGVAIAAAFTLAPWWAAFTGVVIGHMTMWWVVAKLTKKPSLNYHHFSIVLIALFAFYAASYGTMISAMDDAKSIALRDIDKQWTAIAAADDAGQFVELNFRPCANQTVTAFIFTVKKNDVSVCRDATIQRAVTSRGQDFGKSVEAVINHWIAEPALSKDAQNQIAMIETKLNVKIIPR